MKLDQRQLGLASLLAMPHSGSDYRGTSLARKRTPVGPYRRPMSRVLVGSKGGGRFLMGEVTLYEVGRLPSS